MTARGAEWTIALVFLCVHVALSEPAKFVAVGGGPNTFAWSNDGINWNGLGVIVFSFGSGVAYSPKYQRWVAVGNGAVHTVAYSSDGKTWTGVGLVFNALAYSITWGGVPGGVERFVASGKNPGPLLAWSDDGLVWPAADKEWGLFGARANGIAYSPLQDRWIASGSAGPDFVIAENSAVPLVWRASPSPVVFNNVNQVRGLCVACVFTLTGPQAFGIFWNSLNNSWLGLGSGTYSMAISADGEQWTPQAGSSSLLGQGKYAARFGARIVAVGVAPPSGHSMISSLDAGTTWQPIVTPNEPTNLVFSILYSRCLDLWVACGGYEEGNPANNNLTMVYSRDSVTWFPTALGLFGFTVRGCGGLASLPESQPVVLVAAGTVEQAPCNVVLPPASVTVVAGAYQLQASFVMQGTLSVQSGGSLSVASVMQLLSGSVSVARNATLFATGNIIINSATTLTVLVNDTRAGTDAFVMVQVLSTASVLSGTFGAVYVVLPTGCTGASTVTYTTTSLVVTIDWTKAQCDGSAEGRLSPGAIVGIAVGSIVAGVLVAVCIALVAKTIIARRTAAMNITLRQREVALMKPNQMGQQQFSENT